MLFVRLPFTFSHREEISIRKRKMKREAKSVLDSAGASQGAVVMLQQQRSLAALSLSLCHRPCERAPVCASRWDLSESLWESVSLSAVAFLPNHSTWQES